MMFTTFPQKILFAASALLLAGVVTLVVRAGQQAEWQTYQQRYFAQTGQPADLRLRQIVPRLSSQPELCLTCHLGLEEISASY